MSEKAKAGVKKRIRFRILCLSIFFSIRLANIRMAENIFEKVFRDAEGVINAHKMSPPVSSTRKSGQENSGTNNMTTYKNLMKSSPEFAKTQSKASRTMNARKPPTRVHCSPQVRRTPQPAEPQPPSDAVFRVYVRIRPLLQDEEPANYQVEGSTILAKPPPRAHSWKHFAEKSFTVTDIMNEDTEQQDVFKTVAFPLVKKFMQGVDGLIFAYGATSAGKTYTVQGPPEEPGLIPRIVDLILSRAPAKGTERGLLVSCVEVYNEKILDMFGDNTKPLRIGKDGFGFTTVKGITEFEVKNKDDMNKALKDIDNARKQFSTKYNAASSRSHCIFMLKLVTIPLDPKTGKRTRNLGQIQCSRLAIVDLAGSERVTADEKNALTVSEACNINKSMLVLGKCIRELRKLNKGGSAQVPYRESKLTEMFKDFFEPTGRPSVVSIIVNIAPGTTQFDDTMASLQFAADAVECNTKNCDDDDSDSSDMTEETGDPTLDEKVLAQVEAKIRQQVHEEMAEKMKKLQDDYQQQIDEIRCQSAQPYTSKLQQALAQRIQRDAKSRELEECKRERDEERAQVAELENSIKNVQKELGEVQAKMEEEVKKKNMLETNITKMMEATKALHERYVKLQDDLKRQAVEKEAAWQQRVKALEAELMRLQGH